MSDGLDDLAQARLALAKARASIGSVARKGKGQRGNRYVTADDARAAVQEACEEHGLLPVLEAIDPGVDHPDQFIMRGSVVHIATGAECLEPQVLRVRHAGGAQDIMGHITYFTRYLYCLMFNIVGSDDDDGERAQRGRAKSKAPAKTQHLDDTDSEEANKLRSIVGPQLELLGVKGDSWKLITERLGLPAWKLSGYGVEKLKVVSKALDDGTVEKVLEELRGPAEEPDPMEPGASDGSEVEDLFEKAPAGADWD